MLLLSKRQRHAAAAGVGAALAYLAAAEVGSKKPVRVTALFLLASTSMAGMAASAMTQPVRAKAQATENRLNGWFNDGGQVNGNVVVAGDHHVHGNLYGASGVLAVGDHLDAGGNPISTSSWLSVDGNITMLGHINSVGGLTRLFTPVTDSSWANENSTENTNRSRVNSMMDGL